MSASFTEPCVIDVFNELSLSPAAVSGATSGLKSLLLFRVVGGDLELVVHENRGQSCLHQRELVRRRIT